MAVMHCTIDADSGWLLLLIIIIASVPITTTTQV